ncbi:hypothetical protein DCM91_12700 [Chitinophaga costaii]|nr:hypothetical protein DCM91_12700 [Chitinophaga costaii]
MSESYSFLGNVQEGMAGMQLPFLASPIKHRTWVFITLGEENNTIASGFHKKTPGLQMQPGVF